MGEEAHAKCVSSVLERVVQSFLPRSTTTSEAPVTASAWIQTLVHHQLPTLVTQDGLWSIFTEELPDVGASDPILPVAERLNRPTPEPSTPSLESDVPSQLSKTEASSSPFMALGNDIRPVCKDLVEILDFGSSLKEERLGGFRTILLLLYILQATETMASHVVGFLGKLTSALSKQSAEQQLTMAEVLLVRELVREPISGVVAPTHALKPSSTNLARSLARLHSALTKSSKCEGTTPKTTTRVAPVSSAAPVYTTSVPYSAVQHPTGGSSSLQFSASHGLNAMVSKNDNSANAQESAPSVPPNFEMSSSVLEQYVALHGPKNGVTDWSLFNQLAGKMSAPLPNIPESFGTTSSLPTVAESSGVVSREGLMSKLHTLYSDGVPTTYDQSFLQLPAFAQLGNSRVTATSMSSVASDGQNRVPGNSVHAVGGVQYRLPTGGETPYVQCDDKPQSCTVAQDAPHNLQLPGVPPVSWTHHGVTASGGADLSYPQRGGIPTSSLPASRPVSFVQQRPYSRILDGTPAPTFCFQPGLTPSHTVSQSLKHRKAPPGSSSADYYYPVPSTSFSPAPPASAHTLRRCHSMEEVTRPVVYQQHSSTAVYDGTTAYRSAVPPAQHNVSIGHHPSYPVSQPSLNTHTTPGFHPSFYPFRVPT